MDATFDPTPLQIGRGDTVVWDNVGTAAHRVSDPSGMELFDSGELPAGWSGWFTFDAAGRYAVALDGVQTGRIDVPIGSDRMRGKLSYRFTITWAAVTAPTGWAYDVQIRRPGKDWHLWRDDVVRRRDTFKADAGVGTYRFRARLVRLSNDAHSGWSAPRAIDVHR
jgi:hypothetical protein